MAISARRFLVVPDPAFDGATVVSVEPVTGVTPNEAGRQVAQPTRSTTDTPDGDIAMTLSGEPETHVEGVARCTRAGVVEDARWGWVRDGDAPETSLQFRQSPHVVGRRPDVVAGAIHSPAIATARAVRPRLLPLLSGNCLMVWTTRYWMPIWARDATTLATSTETIYLSKLSAATDAWSAAAVGPIPEDVTGAGMFISAVDVTQYPDTGEIIMCVMTSQSMTPGSADPRMLFVYISQDDGATWVLKHRLHFDGDIPDIVLDTDGDGDVDDTDAFQDLALELLDSGRLCMIAPTESNTWSLVSDDRGASWSAILVQAHSDISASFVYAGHGAGATKARNGMAIFTTALRNSDAGGLSSIGMWLTRDGVSFSARAPLPYASPVYQSVDVTACVSPDGWPHVYGTEHASQQGVLAALNPQDWLWGRRLVTRDPTLSDTIADLVPYQPGATLAVGPSAAFHMATGTPLGSYGVPGMVGEPNPCRYDGFVGLDAVLYRGQVLLAVVHQRDGAQPDTDEQPNLSSYGLMVYRLNSWQPIQERVANAYQDVSGTDTYEPAWPAIGRVYNNTWDCYDTPDNEGWSKTGGVTPTFAYAGTSGGYMQVSGSPCYWERVPAGDLIIGLGANVRFVLAVESGGSTSTDAVAVRLSLNDLVGHSDVSIRMKRTGANIEIQLYDNVNAANIGAAETVPHLDWVEILYAQHRGAGTSQTVSVYCAVRAYSRSVDPDWDAPYTLFVNGSTFTCGVPTPAEWIRFGHFTSGTQASSWKGVHLSRSWTRSDNPQIREKCALVQAGSAYADSDATNDRSTTGTGEVPLDNGLDSWMRTCRMLSGPPMFMCRGTRASFRGEATTAGAWDYTTAYAFAAANVQVQPVLREWRSVDDDTIISMVFQAPAGRTFRPDAVAVFGHNLGGVAFQFNATDSWGAPAVSFGLSLPGFGTLDRYFHEWAANATFPLSALGNRVRVTGMSPWRPHQFKSDPGGQQHYVALKAEGTSRPQIFRIIDNTGDTLTLFTDVDGTGITLDGNGAIFCDRFAQMIGHHFPANPMTGYEFCRVVIGQGKHWDADAAFARIGRIVLGTTIEISAPDFEMGWTTGFESGAVVVEQPTGAAYTHRLRPILRTWSADRPWMMPPEEADAVYASPSSQPNRASWAQWLDTMRLIDGDGTACALVWEGERFVGFTDEERVQVCADPLSLAMCHVVGLGDLEQTVYDGRKENLPDGPGCVPRPVSHIRGLRFRETL